ncbi:MAG: hypothetical protein KKB31_01220 [Nanoarchaeota archaeon]|nr:hypothetical protein [Nanoarchaeota archaeon]
MSCICQSCSKDYKIDINIPNYLWKKISPSKNEAGLLCPICIMERLEDLLEYNAFELIEIN